MKPDSVTYPLYGLAIACDRELPFWSDNTDPDLTIVEQELPGPGNLIHDLPDPGGEGRLRIWTEPEPLVEYDGWRFRVAADQIDYAAVGEHRSPFGLVLERVVIPLHRLMNEPGLVAFHGAAVVVDDTAFLFVGPSGAGKSTTARLIAAKAGRLATDDLAVIDVQTMRLMPGAHGVRSFDPVPGSRPVELYPDSPKHWYPFDGPPPPATRLGVVVHLERTDSWRLQRIRGAEAGVTLLEHAFDLQRPGTEWQRRRMENVMKVARNVPLVRCSYPASAGTPDHGPELLARVVELLEES